MMDKRSAISPEITNANNKKSSFFYKVFMYIYKPFANIISSYIKQLKWKHNSDIRIINWDWEEINFNRIALVNLLLNKYIEPVYLEIGCASNVLFNSIPIKNKIGVDPASGGNVRMNSDEFFQNNSIKFDVVFIDGLHTYEQVRRDVINSIKNIKQGGWIAIHDMLPRNWLEHHVPIVTAKAWTGDVWKVAFELLKTEGVEFKILKIDYGVGVIKVNDPQTILIDLKLELLHKEFNYYYDHLRELPIIEWSEAQEWLQS